MRIVIAILLTATALYAEPDVRRVCLAVRSTQAVAAKNRMDDILDTQYGTNFLHRATQSTNRADWSTWFFTGIETWQLNWKNCA